MNQIDELQWEIQVLREKNTFLRRLNKRIRQSKIITKVITKEGDNFRRLMVIESHTSPEGITLVVSK